MSEINNVDLLPEGWVSTTLGDVVQRLPNAKPELEPDRMFGYVDISSICNQTFRILDYKKVSGSDAPSRARRPIRPGDVIFSNVRTYLRNIAIVLENLAVHLCSTGFTVLRSNGAAEPRYLFYYVLTDEFIDCVTPRQTGTHYPATSDRVVFEQALPLPPLAEQNRIVAKVEELLSRVNAARDRLAKFPALLKRFRQSVLAAACAGELTEYWREEQPALESVTDAFKRLRLTPEMLRGDLDLKSLPEKWSWVQLSTILDRHEAFCYGVVQPGEDDPNGVFLIRAGDLKKGTVDVSGLRRIPRSVDASYGRSKVCGGEILLTVVGAGIGESAIVPSICKGFNIARAVAKIPIRKLSARYVRIWLQSQTARSWLDNDAREVARPTLNLEQLRTLPVPLPPIAEQDEIVRRVDALFALAEKIEARLTAAMARVEKITQAILARTFRGELVPTEADLARVEGRSYEPASALLERIRAERTESVVTKSRGRRMKGGPD